MIGCDIRSINADTVQPLLELSYDPIQSFTILMCWYVQDLLNAVEANKDVFRSSCNHIITSFDMDVEVARANNLTFI